MRGSIPPANILPPAYPRGFTFFIQCPIPRPRARKRRQFPAPRIAIYLNYVRVCTKASGNIGCYAIA